MRRIRVVSASVALALLLTGARCSANQFDEVLQAAKKAETGTSVTDIETAGRSLKDFDPKALSSSQRQQQQQLLVSLDRALDNRIGLEVQGAVSAADQQLAALATQTAATVPVSDAQFVADLRIETQAQIKQAACDTLLNAFAPEQTPDPRAAGAEKYAASAIRHLTVKWRLPPFLQTTLGWAEWTQGVVKDGQQVQTAVEANPQAYVTYFAKPQVLRGALAYGKFCYALPGR